MIPDFPFTLEYWLNNKGVWNHVYEVVYKKEYGIRFYKYNDRELACMRVLNKKYWPHQFFMKERIKDWPKMERWCYDNLKSADWRNHGMVFAFKRMEDASYFMLIWS